MPQSALPILDSLLARTPRNADYLLAKAQALTRLNRNGEAVALLEKARAPAPKYEALYAIEIPLLARQNRPQQLASVVKRAGVLSRNGTGRRSRRKAPSCRPRSPSGQRPIWVPRGWRSGRKRGSWRRSLCGAGPPRWRRPG